MMNMNMTVIQLIRIIHFFHVMHVICVICVIHVIMSVTSATLDRALTFQLSILLSFYVLTLSART